MGGVERYQGRLDGEIVIELWSLTETGHNSEGAAATETSGCNTYPGMSMRRIMIDNHEVLTDSEGYLVDPGEWSE